MRTILVAGVLGLSLTGCTHQRCNAITSLFGCTQRSEAARVEDTSIRFPRFHERRPLEVGQGDGTFEMDGAVLRALRVAADDFLPVKAEEPPCWATQAAHTYRVLRQEEVIFIRIDEDPVYCGRKVGALHSGAQYAISKDGRILRRVLDGEPEQPLASQPPDAEGPGEPAAPGVLPEGTGKPLPFLPPE
jgi:hypothetical protein